ncbi:hypothetical protein TH468_04755 [Thalassospira sp. MCCC 1A03138]|nr:hypothetical protein TH468_04755 [Thalassospira sp. MCCC 1A03138]
MGPDERGDQDAAAKIRTQTRAGQRGIPQDMGRRMAEPLRRHSAPGQKGLRELTRSFVMTGEVRLVEEEALNLPGAAAMAAMAAAGSVERRPVDGGPMGAVRPKFVRAPSVAGSGAIAGGDQSG